MLAFGHEHIDFDAIQPPGRSQAIHTTLLEEQEMALHALTYGLAHWNEDLDLRHAYKVLGEEFSGNSNPGIAGRAKTCQELGGTLLGPLDKRHVEGALYYLAALSEGLRQKVEDAAQDDTIRSPGPRYRSMYERVERERGVLRQYVDSHREC